MSDQNRRQFSGLAAASLLTACLPNSSTRKRGSLQGDSGNTVSTDRQEKAQNQKHVFNPDVCCFVKFVQSLSFDEMAETIAGYGYQGIEATIRPKGMILPENVETELPKLVKALKKQGLEITVMTTRINSAEDKVGTSVLRTAAELGIKRYRTDYYRYNLKKPIKPQIDSFRGIAAGLAKLNENLGLTGLYQNHAGAKYLGSTVWDLDMLLKDINPDQLGVAFDIRHATASGGVSWPVLWDIVRDRVRAIYVKDFVWDGDQLKNVALGQGNVSKKFFDSLKKEKLNYPISIHVEYLQAAGVQENLKAIETDFKKLKRLLG